MAKSLLEELPVIVSEGRLLLGHLCTDMQREYRAARTASTPVGTR